MSRRMAKFKRPLESLLPRVQALRAEELAKRRLAAAAGLADVGDFDFY